MSYGVVDEEIVPGIKRDLYVRLTKEVSADALRSIALELTATDPRWYDETFIVYYLPWMRVRQGGWATTHFDRTVDSPTIDVRISSRNTRRTAPQRQPTKPEAGFKMPNIGKQIVTFDDYQRIQSGISYRQVVAIIGAEGEELSRNKINGVPGVMESIETVMYQWVNGNGSNMNAIFQNNKLMQKAQFGLK